MVSSWCVHVIDENVDFVFKHWLLATIVVYDVESEARGGEVTYSDKKCPDSATGYDDLP